MSEIKVETPAGGTSKHIVAETLTKKREVLFRLSVYVDGKVVHGTINQSVMTIESVSDWLYDFADAMRLHG